MSSAAACPLLPRETELIGKWVPTKQGVIADETWRRIEALTANGLRKLETDASGWTELFVDPADNRLWEKTYPQSALTGGGPPKLTRIAAEDARRRYPGVALSAEPRREP